MFLIFHEVNSETRLISSSSRVLHDDKYRAYTATHSRFGIN